MYALCQSLVHQGCQVRVLTTDANGPDLELDVNTREAVEISPALFVRYCHRLADVSVSPTLLRLLMSHLLWADVVHLMAVYSFPTIPTLLACKTLGKPLVWSPRGMLQRWKGTKRLHLKAIWDLVCRIAAPDRFVLHATSEEEARESERRLPGVKTVIVPNGVKIPQIVIQSNGHHDRRFIYLGRLHPKKGIENLLNAYSMVRNSLGTESSLVIAGEGDPQYVERLKVHIQELDLSGTVKMIGHVAGDAKRKLFETADVLIAPSHTENFGIVVSEALAHGVPVIASRGTPWRRLEEIGCGLWTDNDPVSLAAAMRRITSMPLREMGCRGRQWMQREFAWDSCAKMMMRVYQNLHPEPDHPRESADAR